VQGAKTGTLLPEGSSRFAFRRLSEKQKIQKLCVLCVSSEAGGEKEMYAKQGPLVPDSFLRRTAMGVCGKFGRCSANPKKKQEIKLDNLYHNK
jgi:hypothetical protein